MKHVLSFIAALLLSAAASAQAPSDSVGVYAVYGDSLVRIEPNLAINFKTKARIAYHFAGSTSATHFKGKAVIRLCLGDPTMAMSAKYTMFTTSTVIGDFGITKMGKRKDKRRIGYNECTFKFKKADENGHFHLYNTTMDIKQLRKNVYQIEIISPAGEYCLVPLRTILGGNICIFDFTIE